MFRSILDQKRKYVPSGQTDLAATFKRIRKEQAQADKKRAADALEKIQKVRAIGGRT